MAQSRNPWGLFIFCDIAIGAASLVLTTFGLVRTPFDLRRYLVLTFARDFCISHDYAGGFVSCLTTLDYRMAGPLKLQPLAKDESARGVGTDIFSNLPIFADAAMKHIADYFYRRLSLMRGHLLSTRSNPTPHEIHDLRVATRRTTEAIAILADTGNIPASEAKYCLKRLRKFRRAAGDIRDADVCLQRLEESTTPSTRPTMASNLQLAKKLALQRRAAIVRLNRQLRLAASDTVLHRWIDHARTLHLQLDPQSLQLALKRRLAFHRRRFNRRSRRAQTQPTPHHIHRARIAAKQWRYLLELIYDIRAAPVQMIKTAVEKLKTFQKAAGDLQDAVSFQSLFNDAHPTGHPSVLVQRLARKALISMKSVPGTPPHRQ